MLAWSTHTLGLVAVATGHVDLGKRCFSEALHLFVEAKDVSGITLQLDNLSVIARTEGDPVRATRLAAAAVAQQTGMKPTTVASAEEAFEVLENSAVDIVLTDLMLQRTSGLELLKRIRENRS